MDPISSLSLGLSQRCRRLSPFTAKLLLISRPNVLASGSSQHPCPGAGLGEGRRTSPSSSGAPAGGLAFASCPTCLSHGQRPLQGTIIFSCNDPAASQGHPRAPSGPVFHTQSLNAVPKFLLVPPRGTHSTWGDGSPRKLSPLALPSDFPRGRAAGCGRGPGRRAARGAGPSSP